MEMVQNTSLTRYSGSGMNAEIVLSQETVWASKASIAEIFSCELPDVSKIIAEIFTSGELDRDSNVTLYQHGTLAHKVEVYSLDTIISIGYRVDSKKATHFRKWANSVLTQFITDGFVINEDLLRSDPTKLNKLAAKIRELRANESNVYASVRECFRLAASDYEPSSQEVKRFYALLQDKFHHAITRMTSSKLILDRADHSSKNMGLKTVKGTIPTKEEAKTGKNYLNEEEIYRMHLLSEQFLLYAESTALMGKQMSMAGLHEQLDRLLTLNGYPVFEGYKDYLKERAIEHAEREYAAFIEVKKLEHIGIKVDLELFHQGEYNDFKEQISQISLAQLNNALITGAKL